MLRNNMNKVTPFTALVLSSSLLLTGCGKGLSNLASKILGADLSIVSPLSDSYINAANVSSFEMGGTCKTNGTEVTWSAAGTSGSASGSASCADNVWAVTAADMSALADGSVTITVSQVEETGKDPVSVEVIVSKDDDAPVVDIDSPTAGAYVNSSNASARSMNGSCTDGDGSVIISNSDGSVTYATLSCASGSWTGSVDFTSAAQGSMTVKAMQTDAAGNPASGGTVALTKDTVAPVVAISSPAGSSYVNSSNVSSLVISGTCDEEGGAVAISGAVTASATCASGLWTANLNFTAITDGTVSIAVASEDAAGNNSTAPLSLVKDVVAPTMTITSPTASQTFDVGSAGVALGGACEVGTNVSYSISTVTGSVSCSGGNWSATADISALADNSYDVTATQLDAAGNSTAHTVAITKSTCDNKCYLARFTDTQWDTAAAAENVVDFDAYRTDLAASPDKNTFYSTKATTPSKASGVAPIKLNFEVGQPYVIHFRNIGSAGGPTVVRPDGTTYSLTTTNDAQEHYFTSPDFYKSIIVKKLVTASATYYTPYLNDFELNSPSKNGGTTTTEAWLYFVPVKQGNYVMTCKEGIWNNGPHSSITAKTGMYADIEIVGPTSTRTVPFDIPSDFPSDTLGYLPLASDPGSTGSPVIPKYLKKINYAANPASTISAPCTATDYQPYWWNISLGDDTSSVSWSALQGDGTTNGTNMKAHDGSSNTTSGTCGTEFGYVWRFSKAATPSATYSLTSSMFKTIALRKIHDQNAQIKPHLLEKIEFKNVASANNTDITKPGVGQVDLYFMPTVQGTYNFELGLGTGAAANAGSVTVGPE